MDCSCCADYGCCCCFKKKTAYGMLISDWSSDVCSSGLYGARVAAVEPTNEGGFVVGLESGEAIAASAVIAATGTFGSPFIPAIDGADRFGGAVLHSADRQSVVLGQSVSVRVDRGGRRIIKTKIYTGICYKTPSSQ